MKTTTAELKKEIQELVEKATNIDTREDRKHGSKSGDHSLPAELQNRENRLRKIQEAIAATEAEAKGKGRRDNEDQEDPPHPPDKTLHRPGSRQRQPSHHRHRGNEPSVICSGAAGKVRTVIGRVFTDPQSIASVIGGHRELTLQSCSAGSKHPSCALFTETGS